MDPVGGGGGGGGGARKPNQVIPNGDTKVDACVAEQLPRLPPVYS